MNTSSRVRRRLSGVQDKQDTDKLSKERERETETPLKHRRAQPGLRPPPSAGESRESGRRFLAFEFGEDSGECLEVGGFFVGFMRTHT